jgi:hypothetical protein
VEDLGGAEERGEVAFEVEGAEEAAEDHLGLLAVAVALPVVPGEVGGGAEGGGLVEEGAEVQSISAPATWNQARWTAMGLQTRNGAIC